MGLNAPRRLFGAAFLFSTRGFAYASTLIVQPIDRGCACGLQAHAGTGNPADIFHWVKSLLPILLLTRQSLEMIILVEDIPDRDRH
jgi:hypothetical protein